jgi:hypothetical protein
MYPSRLRLSECLASIAAILLIAAGAPAQDEVVQPLVLRGLYPGGMRASATDAWGAFLFSVENLSSQDRHASALVFHKEQPHVQFGRDVWVPASSQLSTWMLVGPGEKRPGLAGEVHSLLYERDPRGQRLVLPGTEERVRSRLVLFRNREPTTTVLLDEAPEAPYVPGQLPQPEPREQEIYRFLQSFRQGRNLSPLVSNVPPGALLPAPQAFDGVDLFVVASNRIMDEPGGVLALRHWLTQGGKVWVMLDLVDEEVAAALLGEALDFRVLDRVQLTTTKVTTIYDDPPSQAVVLEHERPVDLVRVLLPAGEVLEQTVNGWPASFMRPVGRGEILFTTLGPRGWFRPRAADDPPPSDPNLPPPPIALTPLKLLAERLHPFREERPLLAEALQNQLKDEIGYSLVSRNTVALVFVAVLGGALALALALRGYRRPELIGWLGPVAALGGTLALVMLGGSSRRAAPDAVAVAQIVEPALGKEEAAVHGLLAVYRSDSGAVELGTQQGGFFELDTTGTTQAHRFVMTDMHAWHWDNLQLPTGVRFAPFRYPARLSAPLSATAHFGPRGVQGHISAGPFGELSDAVFSTPGGRNLSARIDADGAFEVRGEDLLAKGQFIAGAVLSDRQRLRQEVLRELLRPQPLGTRQDYPRDLLLAWSKPLDMHLVTPPDARSAGAALLKVPVQWVRSPRGQTVTVPGPFVTYRRILGPRLALPTLASHHSADMDLRFQLPASVLPMKVQAARLTVKIDAPAREVVVAGKSPKGVIELERTESPLAAMRIDLSQELLTLDERGGLQLSLAVNDVPGRTKIGEQHWTIEYLDLEVTGQTAP